MITFTFSPTGIIPYSVAMLMSALVGIPAITSSSGTMSITTSNLFTLKVSVIGTVDLGSLLSSVISAVTVTV